MTIPLPELKALLLKSGNRCAFPGCPKVLFKDGDEPEDAVNRSEVAHIVAQSEDGPRGKYPLPLVERDKESNLILLCQEHHALIDDKAKVPLFTVERLRQYKEDHEQRILASTGNVAVLTASALSKPKELETVYSTLFNVVGLPTYVYGAPCLVPDASPDEIRQRIVHPKDESEIYPFIVREGELYAFQNLEWSGGPFGNVIDRNAIHPHPTREWSNDPVKLLWLIELLNRSLHKLTGRKGLQWDKDHKRYYFQPDQPGQAKSVNYRPLNKAWDTRSVVWQPITKRTGQPKPFWLHRAISLKFIRISPTQWCLTMRPEFRVTKDGFTPIASEKIGAKVTRKKSRMYNYDLLGEVQFWRGFLGDNSPRIILNYGDQRAIISTEMMEMKIEWPGIPEQYAKPFKNIEYAETLFTWAELEQADADAEVEEDDEGGEVSDDEE